MKPHGTACSLTAAIITFGSLVGGANAALSLDANVFTGYGKDSSRAHTIDSEFTSGLDEVTVSTTESFEHSGNPGNYLDFSGFASASSAPQWLRTHAQGTVINNFYDDLYDFDLNTGTPSYYVSWAEAKYSETLQYGGYANHYNSRYIMRFTGEITGLETLTLVEIQHGNEPKQRWLFTTPGSYDQIIVSNAFVHGSSPQNITVRVMSSYQMDTGIYPDGATIQGEANFGNTLQVLGVDLRDSNGNLLTGETITGESGSTYAVIEAPEPSSSALLGLACMGILFQRIRR